MEKDLILKKDDLYRLNIILTKFVDVARIDCAIIINKSGRMITYQSESSNYDKTSLSALVSGNFASSSSIANMLDETEFTSMLQEGKKKHLFVTLIDENTILASIFDKRTSLNKIKTCIKNFLQDFKKQLLLIYSRVEINEIVNLDVTEEKKK